ncbi:MAG: transcription-repair coupling factor, partial [Actinomycetales bacterium]
MTLTGLVRAVAPRMSGMLDQARAGHDGTLVVPRAAQSLALALLASVEGAHRPLLVIAATGRQADDLAAELSCMVDASSIAVFPSWETLPHERLSPSLDTVGRRTAVMRRLRHPDPSEPTLRVVVASVRAVLQPISLAIADVEPVRIGVGTVIEPQQVARHLVELGYERVDLVERRGQFAVRGGIVDVFVPTDEHPVRVEFWDDTVESVRSFAVTDQRSLAESTDGLVAGPVRELLFTDQVRAKARTLAGEHP